MKFAFKAPWSNLVTLNLAKKGQTERPATPHGEDADPSILWTPADYPKEVERLRVNAEKKAKREANKSEKLAKASQEAPAEGSSKPKKQSKSKKRKAKSSKPGEVIADEIEAPHEASGQQQQNTDEISTNSPLVPLPKKKKIKKTSA